MTTRKKVMQKNLFWYFGSQKKVNEFLQIIKSSKGLSKADRVNELNKLKNNGKRI